ncbi:hypothetical protein ACP70R_011190 [Stipagrostis hirtigluma subsp. patula]
MAERETSAPAVDRTPATQGPRANTVVEKKLDQLCACLDEAMSSSSTTRLRGPGAEARLVAEIKARIDFLRSLLAAEGECHAGARPGYLAEAEARFSVLEATFDQWSRRALGAPAAAAADDDEEDYVYDGGDEGQGEAEEEDARSGSSCSCTHSCQEAAEGDGFSERDAERQAAETRNEDGIAKKREGDGTREDLTSDDIAKEREAAAAETTRKRTVQRRWWRRGAAWCGAAGVVAAVAVVVGMAMELAAVAHHNVYVVPT